MTFIRKSKHSYSFQQSKHPYSFHNSVMGKFFGRERTVWFIFAVVFSTAAKRRSSNSAKKQKRLSCTHKFSSALSKNYVSDSHLILQDCRTGLNIKNKKPICKRAPHDLLDFSKSALLGTFPQGLLQADANRAAVSH